MAFTGCLLEYFGTYVARLQQATVLIQNHTANREKKLIAYAT